MFRLLLCLLVLCGFGFAAQADEPIVAEGGHQLPPAIAAPEPAANCDSCSAFDFKSVPPIHYFPRLGPFPIPPSGCGAYSLQAALRGDIREAPPKFGYPPLAAMPFSFFDADWRYLDNPKTPPSDFLDELKRVHLGDHWLFSTGGSAMLRYMNEHNSRLGTSNNVYALSRVRSYVDLWYEDRFRIFAEGIFADSLWQDLPRLPIDANRADFLNAFVDVNVGEIAEKPVFIRVGRQELLFGSERLVTPLEWANTRRTFQGVRAFRTSDTFDIDLFWAQPVIPNIDKLDSIDNNQNFAGAWATYKPKPGSAVDLYYLMLDNTNGVTQQGIVRAPYTLHTFGSRTVGDVNGEWLWDVEGAMQLGRLQGQNIVAGMFTAGAGYHAKTMVWNPTIWAYYDYASGDSNPNIGTAHTFNQLFAFGHNYLGWADLVARQNIHDLNAHLFLYPANWMTLWLQYHNFWLAKNQDALYNAAGNAIRRDPTGNAGNYVGSEVDVIMNFHLTRRADVMVGYSHLFGGRFLKDTSNATGCECECLLPAIGFPLVMTPDIGRFIDRIDIVKRIHSTPGYLTPREFEVYGKEQ